MGTEIKGLEGLTPTDVQLQLNQGARFVCFTYCVSILVMTFKRSSAVYFVRADQSALVVGLPYTVLTLFLGWWGFPWGLIYTPMALFENLGGGRDVTAAVREQFTGQV
jgi:hypothetical protein